MEETGDPFTGKKKEELKKFLEYMGLTYDEQITHSIVLRNGQTVSDREIVEQIGLPCFIKPNVGGSSCGATKVKIEEEIQPAIKKAFDEGKS